MSCFPASARTFAAYSIPFRAALLFPWAVICQEWAGVPGVTVAAENCAVGTTKLTSPTSEEPAT